MRDVLAPLLHRYSERSLDDATVIPWSSPVPVFGAVHGANVATVGLNPSNREFMDDLGRELTGARRRFETLGSLGLGRWVDASRDHVQRIVDSLQTYFTSNPYDGWFRRLDALIAGTGSSYYEGTAAHLDLVPFATSEKWANLSSAQRRVLKDATGDTLASIVRDSNVGVLVLNGNAVVSHFESCFGIELKRSRKPAWTLCTASRSPVPGYAYCGYTTCLAGVDLGRRVLVLGFNHNIQSSFGVTKHVMSSIRDWISRCHRGDS